MSEVPGKPVHFYSPNSHRPTQFLKGEILSDKSAARKNIGAGFAEKVNFYFAKKRKHFSCRCRKQHREGEGNCSSGRGLAHLSRGGGVSSSNRFDALRDIAEEQETYFARAERYDTHIQLCV